MCQALYLESQPTPPRVLPSAREAIPAPSPSQRWLQGCGHHLHPHCPWACCIALLTLPWVDPALRQPSKDAVQLSLVVKVFVITAEP